MEYWYFCLSYYLLARFIHESTSRVLAAVKDILLQGFCVKCLSSSYYIPLSLSLSYLDGSAIGDHTIPCLLTEKSGRDWKRN